MCEVIMQLIYLFVSSVVTIRLSIAPVQDINMLVKTSLVGGHLLSREIQNASLHWNWSTLNRNYCVKSLRILELASERGGSISDQKGF